MQTTQAINEMLTENSILEPKSILIIEDDPDIAGLIQIHLQDVYQQVEIASDGISGYKLATSKKWDLLVLDLRLPGKNGLELCRDLRANQNYIPILMLTSKSSELDRVLGLEIGADDYVTKPFSIMELTARIKAILRRFDASKLTDKNQNVEHLASEVHGLELNTKLHKVDKIGVSIDLTAKEFDLLSYFLQHPGQVFSRAHLLNKIWGYGYEGYEHTVNSHINRLRGKIEDKPTQPKIIATVWGVGYKLNNQANQHH